MKRHFCGWLVLVCLGWGWLAGSTGAAAKQAPHLPIKAGTADLSAVVTLSFDIGGTTNCAVLLTGPTSIQHGTPVVVGSNNTISAEITSMSLTGQLPDGSPVQLLAGADLIGVASTGQIMSTNGRFPADSFFDVFAEIHLPGNTNLVNTTAIRIATTLTAFPPQQAYTNLNQAALADATNTNNVLGQLTQLSFFSVDTGKSKAKGKTKTKTTNLGFSVDVAATNTLGLMAVHVCSESNAPSATVELSLSDLTGGVTPNLGCDEITGTNLVFAAKLSKSLRAPDWRGFHSGNWIIYRLGSTGKTNLVAFGRMAGSDGVGTHRFPVTVTNGEDCAVCTHFEGQLQGKLIDKSVVPGGTIRATYAGQFVDGAGNPVSCCPAPGVPPNGPVRLTIDGVVITTCLP